MVSLDHDILLHNSEFVNDSSSNKLSFKGIRFLDNLPCKHRYFEWNNFVAHLGIELLNYRSVVLC